MRSAPRQAAPAAGVRGEEARPRAAPTTPAACLDRRVGRRARRGRFDGAGIQRITPFLCFEDRAEEAVAPDTSVLAAMLEMKKLDLATLRRAIS